MACRMGLCVHTHTHNPEAQIQKALVHALSRAISKAQVVKANATLWSMQEVGGQYSCSTSRLSPHPAGFLLQNTI
eukprot:1159646-Pelagomonas_calceolata.AAC.4